jgi:hypothetical protein
MTGDPISVRAVLKLLLNADRYPRYNAHDWREADLWEKEALDKAETALASPDDPPDLASWLAALRAPGVTGETRDTVFRAMHDYFEPKDVES